MIEAPVGLDWVPSVGIEAWIVVVMEFLVAGFSVACRSIQEGAARKPARSEPPCPMAQARKGGTCARFGIDPGRRLGAVWVGRTPAARHANATTSQQGHDDEGPPAAGDQAERLTTPAAQCSSAHLGRPLWISSAGDDASGGCTQDMQVTAVRLGRDRSSSRFLFECVAVVV